MTAISIPIILCKQFEVTSGGHIFLEACDHDWMPGIWYEIIGPASSGKTTLLNTIAGFHDSWTGQLNVLGCDMAPKNHDRRRSVRRKMGFATQIVSVLMDKTMRLNVSMALQSVDIESKSDIDQRVSQILEHFYLSEKKLIPAKHLSWTELAFLQLIQATVHNPQLLLIDHVLQYLDLPDREIWIGFLKEYYIKQNACIISTGNHPLLSPGAAVCQLQLNNKKLEPLKLV